MATLTAAVHRCADASPSQAPGRGSAQLLERIGRSLESLVAAAKNADWTSAADVLEFEVADLVPRWRAVLRALERSKPGLDAPRLSYTSA